MEWLVIAAVVLIALAAGILLRKPDPFRDAATSLALDHSRSVPELLPRLGGTINGFAIRVDVPEQNSPAIRYRVFYPDLGMALRLERETTISRTLGALGSGDQEIGAKGFDDTFRVNTSRPDALQQMMTPELRDRLVALVERYPSVIIADGEISLVADKAEPTAEAIVQTVNDLTGMAVLLDAGRPAPLPKPSPRSVTPPAPAPNTDTVAPAAPQEKTVEPPQPAPQPMPDPAPEPVADLPDEPEPSTGLPDGFFDDVFGESRLSFESDDRFDREIRGRTVRLSGAVKQSSHYQNISDVSPATGTKAIVTVAQIESDLYGKTGIDAIVYLAGALELNRGDSVAFTGKVEAVDAFMRNLVVADASLTNA